MTKDRRANGLANGKAWSGRFREPTHRLVEAFTSSVTVDRRLYAQDIQGSIAHCKTLEKARVLTQTESRTIVQSSWSEGELHTTLFIPYDFFPPSSDSNVTTARSCVIPAGMTW